MSDSKSVVFFFGELQVHATAYEKSPNSLVITIFLPDEIKGNPYVEKTMRFIEAVLKNENIFPRCEPSPADKTSKSGIVYRRNIYNFIGYSSERMYKPVCDALREAERIFRVCGGSIDRLSEHYAEMVTFEESLESAMPPPRVEPYQSFEQRLWGGINEAIIHFSRGLPAHTKLNDRFISRKVKELAVTRPQFGLSDIKATLKASGVSDISMDQADALAENLARIIRGIQGQQAEQATKKALDEFNRTSSAKLCADKTGEIAKKIAERKIWDKKNVAFILHEYDPHGKYMTVTKDGRRIDIIDTFLAGQVADAIESALNPQRTHSM